MHAMPWTWIAVGVGALIVIAIIVAIASGGRSSSQSASRSMPDIERRTSSSAPSSGRASTSGEVKKD